MNLYINSPYKTGEHKNGTKTLLSYVVYKNKLFFFTLLRSLVESVVKSAHIYSKHKHAKNVKTKTSYRHNFKSVGFYAADRAALTDRRPPASRGRYSPDNRKERSCKSARMKQNLPGSTGSRVLLHVLKVRVQFDSDKKVFTAAS